MARDPFEDSKQRVEREKGSFALGIGEVVASPDDTAHQVVIQPTTKTGEDSTVTRPSPATVMVSQKGDVCVPQEGDMVVFGRFKNRQNVVLGVLYSKQSKIRTYKSEERHIGSESGGGTFIHGPFGVVPKRDEDPSDPVPGSVWYRTDLDEYRGVEGGTKVSFNTTAV